MHFFYDIPIPHDTVEATPYTKILGLTYGVITHMQIVIPPGPQDLAHLQILYHEFQLYPLSRGEAYHGDAVSWSFDERMPIYSAPYELKARAWNTDDTYDHTLSVAIAMLRPEDIPGYDPTRTLQALANLIGEEIE